MEKQLNLCPVCQNKADFLDEFERDSSGRVVVFWSVYCPGCGLETGFYNRQQDAAKVWNNLRYCTEGE